MNLEANAAPGIHRVEDAFTNWYLVEDGDRIAVVDTGVRSSWESLHQALDQLGLQASQIDAVVLTHAHFDHIGFAERARSELGVPVWVHENDVPLAHHPQQYGHERPRSYYLATQPKALPIVAALLRSRAFWPQPIDRVQRYQDGVLPVPGSPQVVFTPGHTLGHCSLYLPDRDALIVGDALVTLNPYRGTTGPQIVSGAATADSERNLACLDALTETGASTLLTGHGEVWRDGARAAVDAARAVGPS
jgi:glyoxylase-like metal-dependent hydrolase (beta-lactamase superfamily II)